MQCGVWCVMCIITFHTARGLFGGEQQPAVDETAVTWLFRRLPTIAPWLLLQSSHRNAIHCNIHCNPPLPPWSWLKTQLESFVTQLFQTRADYVSASWTPLGNTPGRWKLGPALNFLENAWRAGRYPALWWSAGLIFTTCASRFWPLHPKSQSCNIKVSFCKSATAANIWKCRHLPLMESKLIAAGKVWRKLSAALWVSIDPRVVLPWHHLFWEWSHIQKTFYTM